MQNKIGYLMIIMNELFQPPQLTLRVVNFEDMCFLIKCTTLNNLW